MATPSQKKRIYKFLRLLLIIFIIGFVYYFFKDDIISLLQKIPWLWNIISYFANEIGNKTWLGLFYLSFFGALFFIFLPVDIVFLTFLSSGKPFFIAIPIVVIGSLLGLTVDYLIGYGLSYIPARKKLIETEEGEGSEETEEKGLKKLKFKGLLLLTVNIVPTLPFQLVALGYGTIRYNFKRFLILCLIGQGVRFNLVFMGVTYLKPYYTVWFEFVKNWIGELFGRTKEVLSI